MKATILYVKHSGHALAVLTRAAFVEAEPADDPQAVPPEVTALAGAALPVRMFDNAATGLPDAAGFSIPAERLAALTLDVQDAQLLSPRNFAVVDDESLAFTPPTALPAVTLDASHSALNVTLTAATAVEVKVALHVTPEVGASGRPLVLQGVFTPATPSAQTVRFNLGAILSGTYAVLVLAQGYRPAMRRLVV